MGFVLSALNDSQCFRILKGTLLCCVALFISKTGKGFSCSHCRWLLQWLRIRKAECFGDEQLCFRTPGATIVFWQTLLLWLILGKADDWEWHNSYRKHLTLTILATFGEGSQYNSDSIYWRCRQFCTKLSMQYQYWHFTPVSHCFLPTWWIAVGQISNIV